MSDTKKMWLLFFMMTTCAFSFSQKMDTPIHKHPVLRKVAAPVTLIMLGFLTWDEDDFINRFQIQDERDEHAAYFDKHIDDYLQYVPAATVYVLNLAGVKGKNSISEQTFLLIKSELLMGTVVYTLKSTTNVERPDGSTYNSFPSGHTAQAFVAATFLHKEYGHKSIWYSIGGYSVATTVGCMRVLGNRHWLSDVFIGAGIGILSTELVYATHRYKWSKRKIKLSGLPTLNNGSYGVYLSLTL
jgi:membrane-associated phospholipid phosphatase